MKDAPQTRIVTDGRWYKAQLLVPFWFGQWGRLVWRDLQFSDYDNYRDCAEHLTVQLRRREGWKVADGRAPATNQPHGGK